MGTPVEIDLAVYLVSCIFFRTRNKTKKETQHSTYDNTAAVVAGACGGHKLKSLWVCKSCTNLSVNNYELQAKKYTPIHILQTMAIRKKIVLLPRNLSKTVNNAVEYKLNNKWEIHI